LQATLANGRPNNLDALLGTVSTITTKARTRPALLHSFITGSELPQFL